LSPSKLNPARGEVTASLGGRSVRLCVTLGALAQLEGHFGVAGFDALGERLKHLGAADLGVMLAALSMDDAPIDMAQIALSEALGAVVAAFEALHG